jgi:HD-GYP domain-containing protein (c-di-GMP phosphodiesterase class II)
MSRLQQVLQVADVVTALTSPRSYRKEKSKEEIIAILKDEADRGKLSREVVRAFTTFYDQIMSAVKEKSTEQLSMYRKLSENYEITFKSIK